MARQNWKWYGHAGHLIVAQWCRFHLLTYVNGYLISTVGEYFPDREVRRCFIENDLELLSLRGDDFDHKYMKKYGFREIGCDRKYETMVFIAKKCDCGCGEYMAAHSECVDFKAYNLANLATEGHDEMCETWDKANSPWSIKHTADWRNNIVPLNQLKANGLIDDYEYDELVRKLELKLIKGEE